MATLNIKEDCHDCAYSALGFCTRSSEFANACEAITDALSIDAEVVRCKDCKWWDKSEDSPFGYCMAIKHGYMSANWEIGIYRKYKGDFYCADGEREEE